MLKYLKSVSIGCCFLLFPLEIAASPKPNILFIVMDDVGYGNFSCLGNPFVSTPHTDRLYRQCVRLTNYHSGTTCSPSRAALMTGRHYNKTGTWHTIIGRSFVREGVPTLPEILTRNGYATAIFGKWSLGDNYPMRPQDRGFQQVLIHGGSGIGESPDYWGNDYFDDTYYRNGVPEKFGGYCTDIWTEEALQYIEAHALEKQPFFCYLSFNAAHKPHLAPERNVVRFRNQPNLVDPDYHAMVDNIDQNLGKLLDKLDELNIADNTIILFTSDNGTANGAGIHIDKNGFVTKGFNAGMRGAKGQPYEGGHRVPFFIRYRDKLQGGKDIIHLSSCMDILPTLLELAGISASHPEWDGESLVPYLKGTLPNAEKIYIADVQRGRYLQKYKDFSVMMDSWRLVGEALFNLKTDPEQRMNVSSAYPGIVEKLKQAYEKWWQEVISLNPPDRFNRIVITDSGETKLTSMDIFPDDDSYPAWNHRLAEKESNVRSGSWKLRVESSGKYRIEVRQLPREAPDRLRPRFEKYGYAFFKINGQPVQVQGNLLTKTATFEAYLSSGELNLEAGFGRGSAQEISAQYVYISKIGGSQKR